MGCEFSGVVRNAFRKLNHEAYSCDLLPSSDNSPYHFQEDLLDLLKRDSNWDLAIFHPPCTYLCNIGVRWLRSSKVNYSFGNGYLGPLNFSRWREMENGAYFFKCLLNQPIPRICIENPISHKYALDLIGRKYDQIIQPWMFGTTETKATCLWLKNLPKLVETNNVKKQMQSLPKKDTHKIHYMGKSKDRGLLRSVTYQCFADNFAAQWGPLL